MRTDAEIDAETTLRDAKTNVRDKGGSGYERDLHSATANYEALTGLSTANVKPYGE